MKKERSKGWDEAKRRPFALSGELKRQTGQDKSGFDWIELKVGANPDRTTIRCKEKLEAHSDVAENVLSLCQVGSV